MKTGKAFVVEIKPRGFENHTQLLLRKEVAENYIRWKNYDWKFRVIFDEKIIMDEEQPEEFEQSCKLKSETARKIDLNNSTINMIESTIAIGNILNS